MKNYFNAEIMPHIKGIQTFETEKEGKWAQYDLKEVDGKSLTFIYDYFRAHYREVWPGIQRKSNVFVGHIQVKIS